MAAPEPHEAGQAGEADEAALAVAKSKFDAARLLLEEDIGHVQTPSPRAAPASSGGDAEDGEAPVAAPAAAPTRVVGKTRVLSAQKGGAADMAGDPPRARARAKVVGVKPSLDNAIASFDRIAASMEDDMQRKLEGAEPLPEGVPPEDGGGDDLLDSLFAEMSASAAPAPSLSLQPEQQEEDSEEDVELFETERPVFADSPLFKNTKQPEPQPASEMVPEQAPEPEPEPQPRSDPQLDPQAADQKWVKLGGQAGLVAAFATAPPPHRAGGPAVSYSIMSPAGGDRYVEFAVLLRPVDSRSAGLSAEDSLLDALVDGRVVSERRHTLDPRPAASPTDRRVVDVRGQSTSQSATLARLGGVALEESAKAARSLPRWIRSCEVSCCMACATSFSLRVAKHHCRCCGWTVCGGCSRGTLVLERWLEADKPHALRECKSAEPLRVCDRCLEHGPTLTDAADDFIGGGSVKSVGLNHSVSSGRAIAAQHPLQQEEGVRLCFRFSQIKEVHKEITSASVSKEVKKMIPKLPPKEAKRRRVRDFKAARHVAELPARFWPRSMRCAFASRSRIVCVPRRRTRNSRTASLTGGRGRCRATCRRCLRCRPPAGVTKAGSGWTCSRTRCGR